MWIHPNTDQWQLSTYKKGALYSSSEELLACMKKDAQYPTGWVNCYIILPGINPIWEDPQVKKGGSFGTTGPLSTVPAELYAQTEEFISFCLQDKMKMPGGEEVDMSFYFVCVNFSVNDRTNRRSTVTPKLWLRDCNLYEDALTALQNKFPKYDFAFEAFDKRNQPRIAAPAGMKMKAPAKLTVEQQLTTLLNNLTRQTLDSTISCVHKLLKGKVNVLETMLVQYLFRQRDHTLLIELATEIDFTNHGLLDNLLKSIDSVIIENDDPETVKDFQRNLGIAKTRLQFHMYDLKRNTRDNLSKFIDHELTLGKLDVIIEILRCLTKAKTKDVEFIEQIRNYIITQTKKSGKIYYVMLDIFDDLNSQ